MRDRAFVILGLLLVAGVFALVFRDRVAALTGSQLASAVYLLLVLMLVGGGAYAGRSARLGSGWLRNAAIWAAILIAIALAYPVIAPFLSSGAGLR